RRLTEAGSIELSAVAAGSCSAGTDAASANASRQPPREKNEAAPWSGNYPRGGRSGTTRDRRGTPRTSSHCDRARSPFGNLSADVLGTCRPTTYEGRRGLRTLRDDEPRRRPLLPRMRRRGATGVRGVRRRAARGRALLRPLRRAGRGGRPLARAGLLHA